MPPAFEFSSRRLAMDHVRFYCMLTKAIAATWYCCCGKIRDLMWQSSGYVLPEGGSCVISQSPDSQHTRLCVARGASTNGHPGNGRSLRSSTTARECLFEIPN